MCVCVCDYMYDEGLRVCMVRSGEVEAYMYLYMYITTGERKKWHVCITSEITIMRVEIEVGVEDAV